MVQPVVFLTVTLCTFLTLSLMHIHPCHAVAIEEIEALEKAEESAPRDVVYQVELALFPVTKGGRTP